MKTFKINENELGIIENIHLSNGDIFNHIDEFIEYCENHKEKLYGENVHHIMIAVESVSDNFKISSTLKNGLTARMKIGKSTLIDIAGWKMNIGADKASYEKIKKLEKEGYVSSSPSAVVNREFYEAMTYSEALLRAKFKPSPLDAYLSTTKMPTTGFKPAYTGGILTSPADPNKVYKNVVSYDISSAYPYAALSTEMPMSESYTLTKEDTKRLEVKNGRINIKEGYGFIGIFKVYGAKRKSWTKTPMIKRDDRSFIENGYIDPLGLVSGDITVAMCPDDLITFDLQYSYEKIDILRISLHRLGPLPRQAVDFIEEAYYNKNMKEDGTVEREKAKVALNTIVGLWGTDPFNTMKKRIVKDGVIYESYEGDENENFKKYSGKAGRAGRTAGYPRTWDFRWAVYTVAAVRRRIVEAEKELYNNGMELLYVDTDSIKVAGNNRKAHKVFEKLNNKIEEKYKTIGLGVWTDESEKYHRAVFRGVKVYFHESRWGTRMNKVSGVDKASAENFNNMPLKKLADKDTPIKVMIKRRSTAILANDPFGAKHSYAIRELEITY